MLVELSAEPLRRREAAPAAALAALLDKLAGYFEYMGR